MLFGFEGLGLGIGLLLLWVIAWKGYALWLAARRGEKWWFIALLIINTAGILEIIYIFFVAKNKDTKEDRIDSIDPQL